MNNDTTLKIDLHNIPEALTTLRKELKQQQEMEAKATPGRWVTGALPPAEWRYVITANTTDPVAAVSEWDEQGNLCQDFQLEQSRPNAELISLSRNLNPARLKVAEELCAMADWEMNDLAGSHDPAEAHHFLKLAVALLGMEVVE